MGHESTTDRNIVYVLDFGLARYFTDEKGKIRPVRPRTNFRGTMVYCSLTAHLHHVFIFTTYIRHSLFLIYVFLSQDLCPKDDMISLFYAIVEFWQGYLPWRTQTTHEQMIEIKQRYSPDVLAKELHKDLPLFTEHLSSLKYTVFRVLS